MQLGIRNTQELCAKGSRAPTEVLLLRDGKIGINKPGLEDLTLDKESAEVIIAEFDKQGVKVPIDYHHATHTVGPGQKAIAAGWITQLTYRPGEGLFAAVEWNDEAREEIESHKFKYLSPTIRIDRATNKVFKLEAVALTNTPAIRNMPELVAAESRWLPCEIDDAGSITITNGSDTMSKKKTPIMRRPIAWRLVTAQEAPLPGVDIDVAALPEEQVAEIDELGAAINMLGDKVRAAGGELEEGADALSIVAMAGDMLSGAKGGEGDEAAAASVTKRTITEEMAEALSITKGSSVTVALDAINRLKVAKGANKSTAERLASVEQELAERNETDKKRTITAAIAVHVEAGRLNPNDTDQMTAALALANNDLESFEAFAKSLPVVADPTKIDFTGGTVSTKGKRGGVIAMAAKEYRSLEEAQRDPVAIAGWVNAALDDEREGRLTKAERETLEV